MFNTIIIRNGEIAIKGSNRANFEKRLMTNIKSALYGLQGYKVHKGDGRVYIDADESIMQEVINRVSNVFGVVSMSPATLAALARAVLTTFAGSTIPASTRSQ